MTGPLLWTGASPHSLHSSKETARTPLRCNTLCFGLFASSKRSLSASNWALTCKKGLDIGHPSTRPHGKGHPTFAASSRAARSSVAVEASNKGPCPRKRKGFVLRRTLCVPRALPSWLDEHRPSRRWMPQHGRHDQFRQIADSPATHHAHNRARQARVEIPDSNLNGRGHACGERKAAFLRIPASVSWSSRFVQSPRSTYCLRDTKISPSMNAVTPPKRLRFASSHAAHGCKILEVLVIYEPEHSAAATSLKSRPAHSEQ